VSIADADPRLFGLKDKLRRLMCNVLLEQVRQVAQRSAQRVVDPLGAGVGRNLGGQACQQLFQRLGAVALQRGEVSDAAGARPKAVITPSGSTTSATLKP
jgi:hypothetical protein